MLHPTRTGQPGINTADVHLVVTYNGNTIGFIISLPGSSTPPASFEKPIQNIADDIKERIIKIEQIVLQEIDQKESASKAHIANLENEINATGKFIWQEYIPDEMKSFFWKNIVPSEIKTFQIFSDNHIIPWEIVKPFRKNKDGIYEELNFLGIEYSIGRWFLNFYDICSELTIDLVKLYFANNQSYKDEVNELKLFFETNKIKSTLQPSSIEFDLDEPNLIHFSGHHDYNFNSPSESELLLNSGYNYKPMHLTGREFNRDMFVFLNACRSALNFSLKMQNGPVKSWPRALLTAGAKCFIGTQWKVSNNTAKDFATYFYKDYFSGENKCIANSLKNSINHLTNNHHGLATNLSYVLYGNPNLKARFKENGE